MHLFTKFFNQTKFALLVALLFSITSLNAQLRQYDDAWGDAGIKLTKESPAGVSINFSITSLQFVDNEEIDGPTMKDIQMPQVFLPNDEGMPNLPGFSRNIAIPQGAQARVVVKNYRVETVKDIAIAPAPRIPLDTEDGPLEYNKNERVYTSNAYYPAEPFLLSEVTQIRGVDIVTFGITPFQYNPVTKELLIYRDVEVDIIFEGGNGNFGEDRLRSRWFDQVLQDAIGNYHSLPQIDYSARIKQLQNRDDAGYEYLIIVPNSPVWMPYAEQIKEWRTKQGIITGIVTLNEVGGNTATILKNYITDAYNNWDIPPVAILLMADYGTDANNRIIAPIHNNYCVSDNILVDMNNNNMPDIIHARMTAENETQLQTMVSKMLDYEANPPTSASFYNNPVTALGWQTERWFQICIETMGGYWREVQDKEPIRVNQIYSGTPGAVWSTATNTNTVVDYFGPNGLGYIPASPAELGGWNSGTTQMITNAINDGTFFILHRDHGLETGWGEPYYRNPNIDDLTNTQNNEMPYVYSINCLTGKYNWGQESFTEKFHRHTHNGQNAGALGVLAASEVSYSFVNDCYVWGSFDNMQPDFMPDYGNYVDERGYLPAFGNAAGKYFLQQSQWPYNTNNKLVTYHLFHHHGGAFMQVYSEVPQTMAVTHNPILYSGETSFTVTAEEGAWISLTVNGEIIGVAQSTGGATSITIDSQIPPNVMVVTVTKQNYFRYEANVEVIPPSGPYVVGHEYEINDAAGNNDGLMDYGETISLHMTLKNVGVEQANNVSTTISSESEYVTILDDNAYFGNIAPDGTVTVNDAFSIEASANIPDNHDVSFTLTSTDGTDSWISYISIKGHAPHIKYSSYIIDDAQGNNNGLLDPGETAPMIVTVENTGSAAAYNVAGLLTSSDPYVSVNTAQPQNIGDLAAGSTGNATFVVTASSSVPAGYEAEVTINLEADLGVTQQDVITLLFPDYCYPTANCSYGDGFTGFSLEQISNMSNGCSPSGYGDFTDMIAEIEAGQTYTVQWSTGYSNQEASLWIDLNDNKEFEDSERLITDFNMNSSGQVYSTDFTVPAGDFSGNKRLRIRANWQNSSTDPCANFSYGETEDYTVSFGAPTYLAPPQNVAATVTGNDVTITWEAPEGMGEDVNGYNVYRDGQMIANMITAQTFTDLDCPPGSYWFSVTAVYTQGESGVADPVQVNIGALDGKLQGFIRDALTKHIVPNAWVSALNTDYGAVTYNTPFGSHYTLNLPGGSYDIECHAPGYQPVVVTGVTVVEGATRSLNFYMIGQSDGDEGAETLTGISQFTMEELTIYPNPATDEVNINVSTSLNHVRIINNVGQVVYEKPAYDQTLKVNTSNLQQGVYFIEIQTENSKFVEKLVIR
jgi:hypothetical protein